MQWKERESATDVDVGTLYECLTPTTNGLIQLREVCATGECRGIGVLVSGLWLVAGGGSARGLSGLKLEDSRWNLNVWLQR